MGVGKSTVGKQLAEFLDYEFLDLDDYIEEKENCSISTLFKTKGEVYFRKLEAECLDEILTNRERIILSLGGGTPCYGDNMSVLTSKTNCFSVYLKMSPSILSKRLFDYRNTRPLIAHISTQDELQKFISIHLFERQDYYMRANSVVTIDHLTSEEVVKEIVGKLV